MKKLFFIFIILFSFLEIKLAHSGQTKKIEKNIKGKIVNRTPDNLQIYIIGLDWKNKKMAESLHLDVKQIPGKEITKIHSIEFDFANDPKSKGKEIQAVNEILIKGSGCLAACFGDVKIGEQEYCIPCDDKSIELIPPHKTLIRDFIAYIDKDVASNKYKIEIEDWPKEKQQAEKKAEEDKKAKEKAATPQTQAQQPVAPAQATPAKPVQPPQQGAPATPAVAQSPTPAQNKK